MAPLKVWWFAAVIGCLLALGTALAGAPVHVSLRHGWHNYTDGAAHAAPLLEMLEAAHDVWPRHFYTLVSLVWESPSSADYLSRMSYKEQYRYVEEQLRRLGSGWGAKNVDDRLDEWRIQVAQHAQSARIESYYQLFNSNEMIQELNVQCNTFALVNDQAYCSPAEAREIILRNLTSSPHLLSSDHVYPSQTAPAPTVVLYADPYSATLTEFHNVLKRLASEWRIKYVLRWRPSMAPVTARPMSQYLSGFGAAMHLKKVDYLVLDDRHIDVSEHAELNLTAEPDRVSTYYDDLQERMYAYSGTQRVNSMQEAILRHSNLTLKDTLFVGQAAAHVILSSDDPLSAWESLALDFPAHSAGLSAYSSALPEDDPIVQSLNSRGWREASPGVTQLWINGRRVVESELQPITVLRIIQEEWDLIQAFGAPEIGVSPSGVQTILSSELIRAAFLPSEQKVMLYDASDRIERAQEAGMPVISWINDLRSDKFSIWPGSIQEMSQYRWITGFPLVNKNFFQLVVLLDIRDPKALSLLSMYMEAMLPEVAVRWGLVPVIEDEETEVLAQVLWLGLEALSPFELPLLWQRLAHSPSASDAHIDPATARAILQSMLPSSFLEDSDVIEFLQGKHIMPRFQRMIELSREYQHRLHTVKRPGSSGVAYLNGQELSLDEHFVSQLVAAISHQVQLAWVDMRSGYIDEKDRASEYFYDLPGTARRRSALVTVVEDAHALRRPTSYLRLTDLFQMLGPKAWIMRQFLYMPGDVHVSLRIIGDLNAAATRKILLSALEAMKTGSLPFRLSFAHLAHTRGVLSDWLLDAMHSETFSKIPPAELYDALQSDDMSTALAALSASYGIQSSGESWKPILAAFTQLLDLPQDWHPILLLNGQVLDHIEGITDFDVNAVVSWEETFHIKTLLNSLDVPVDVGDMRAQALEAAVSVLGSAYAKQSVNGGPFKKELEGRDEPALFMQNSLLTWHLGDEASPIHVAGLMDPISANAPVMASLIRMLSSMHGVRVSMLMNPRLRQPTLPLQKFTRFDYRVAPHFNDDGDEVMPSLTFAKLPEQAVLTMQIQAPRSLVAMADEAVYDLDNVRLADVHGSLDAVYSVNSVLIEGHARAQYGPIPEGLQLVLSTQDGRYHLDTIVMENLGYFQFRAQPGHWSLNIRDGRSSELYDMISVGTFGWSSPPVSQTGSTIMLDALSGALIFPVFQKRPGKEADDLIADVGMPTTSKLPTFMRGLFKHANHALQRIRAKKGKHADINIFTLASGHLYERMTYIMILRCVFYAIFVSPLACVTNHTPV